MKRSLLLYLTAAFLSLLLLGGCASSGAAEGSSGVKNGTQTDQAAEGTTAEKKHEKMSADDLMKDLDYNPAEWAKLPDNYDSLALKVEGDYEYSEEKFKEMINQMLSSFTSYEDTDKKVVEDGDVVNIDYEGKIEGKTFDGGSAEDQDLEIGSGSFIEGFESGLVGKKVGETVSLDLQFPEEYAEDVAGKKVTFTVTINSIKKKVVTTYDTLTDEFVKENMGTSYGYETKDEFLKEYKKFFEEDLKTQKKQAIMSAYNAELFEKTDFSAITKDALDKEYKKNMDLLEDYAKENGMKLDEYLESAGVDKDSYREQFEENYKHTIMYQSLVKAMDYTLDKTEADEEIQNYIGSYGISEEEFYKQFGSKEEVYRQIAYSHVMEEMAEKLDDKDVIDYTEPDNTVQQPVTMNKKQTIFILIGLVCLLLALILAILQIQANIDEAKAKKELADQTEAGEGENQETEMNDQATQESQETQDSQETQESQESQEIQDSAEAQDSPESQESKEENDGEADEKLDDMGDQISEEAGRDYENRQEGQETDSENDQ